ncbi:MAG: hypothetical protein DYH05_11620 [Acidobacteria bacterium ACB1]|nr:hypothetical protein [Acidobacteria bacterium ACB1]
MGIGKRQIVICALGFVVTVGVFLAVRAYDAFTSPNPYSQFFIRGYDFRKMQDEDEDFSRLKVGETIDIGKIVAVGNAALPANGNLVLLAVVDPKCAYCVISKDIYASLQNGISDKVSYFPVVFNGNAGDTALTGFSRSIGFQEIATWDDVSTVPETLSRMPTPAHILVDRHGKVLQVWFSSSRDEDVRKRMTEQMLSDLQLISRVYPAIISETTKVEPN